MTKQTYFMQFHLVALCFALASAANGAEEKSGSHSHNATKESPQRTAPPSWSNLPLIMPSGRRDESGKTPFIAYNINGDEMQIYSPEKPGAPQVVSKTNGIWPISLAPGQGGQYWMTIRTQTENETTSANTVWSFPGKPPSPAHLIQTPRGGLELLPSVLIEFGGIREGESREFIVRQDGKPLAGVAVRLETAFGTRTRAISDSNGIAKLSFPRDFDPDPIKTEGGATRTRRGFVVAVEQMQNGTHYLTSFNGFYYPDLMRERSIIGGFGFLALGMLFALPMLRRKDNANA